jgi:histone deacetylase 11
MKVVYESGYNFGLFGIEKRWHPFDTQKFRRAWKRILAARPDLARRRTRVPRLVSEADLKLVHDAGYLATLGDRSVIARIVEVPQLARLPAWLLDRVVLRPMRLQTAGTIAAAREALTTGLVFQIGGGFHHAKPNRGEGFCCYADVAIAVAVLRRDGLLKPDDRIVYVDLDVHLGNGVARCFADDPLAFLFDMYDPRIFAAFDTEALKRIDCPVPLPGGCTGTEYLDLLAERLPPFLDSAGKSAPIRLAIYNAGTDVYVDDLLGGVNCSADDVLRRDLFVVDELRNRGVPTVIVTSGGYSEESHRLIAATALELATRTD